MLDKDYRIPERGKPSIFVGERESSVLGLLEKSLRFGVINKSLRKLRGLVTNSEHHHQAHQCALQPCPIYESDHNRCTKMTSFLLELVPLTPLQTRKIYPYHISFTNYILRPCQHKNIFLRCDSDISPTKNISLLHFTHKIYFAGVTQTL